jgi:broad-specificity NMP kinase
MRSLLLALTLVVGVAQATPAIHDDSNEAMHADCDQVARFAKAIATLRESGITEDKISEYITQPRAQPFPINLVLRRVYQDHLNPTAAYQSYYTQCLVVGYDHLLQAMQDADDLVILRQENALLKARLAQRDQDVARLQQALDQGPTRIVEKLVPTYGSPIETNR